MSLKNRLIGPAILAGFLTINLVGNSIAKDENVKSDERAAKAKIRVTLTDEQASKILKGSKAITAQELSRQTGVKISAANSYLIKSLEKGTIKKIAGHSGHYIYQPLSA